MDNLKVISKYGYSKIAIFAGLFILSLLFGVCEYFFGFLLLLSIFVYRNPERLPAIDDENAVLSPVDGKIEYIKKSIYNSKEYTEIMIKNSLFDSGVLRSIANLKVKEIRAKNGLNLLSNDVNKNLINSRMALVCDISGKEVIVRVNLGFGRKVHFENIKELKAGRRFGFIVSGRVSLFLPTDTRLNVSVGNSIKATELIGFLGDK
ncbi:phosphatidylserine decarboxylase-related protein [Campylobacter iguaniorum]|uniref:phosphatidylserine decarboxylase n=1 Tax=Campylobacter iguaniorum TaxID=1244531 RepID=UPI0007C8CFEC|nr:phosphatidylserine decarboxylase [Campylobacter iguaniorum]ANE36309.1 phosphatidylserine decarboxylase-related protein [Campylobacter iguaniorum]